MLSCQKKQSFHQIKKADLTSDELLIQAIEDSDIDQLAKLIDEEKISNINMVKGQSLLKKAFDRLEFNIANFLLENGADPNILVMHKGKQMPLFEYLIIRSQNEPVGYYVIMLRSLLNHHVDLSKASSLQVDYFVTILESRVTPLAEKGDLLFTSWLYLLQDMFRVQCFDNNEYLHRNLQLCSNYIGRINLFLEHAKRNQVVELNVGNIQPFLKNFDLCPHSNEKLIPGVKGC